MFLTNDKKLQHVYDVSEFTMNKTLERAPVSKQRSPQYGRSKLSFSIIIPVRNESQFLADTINRIRQSAPKELAEIIVVDGQSTDNTVEIAKPLADKVLVAKHAGRSYQMHQGALVASGAILVFLHADTQLPPKWPSVLIRSWKKIPKPVATAFRPKFDQSSYYYRMIAAMANLRTRWITGVPHGDQAIAVERAVYLSVGGFPIVPIMEEYHLIRKLKPYGSVRILSEEAITSTRRYQKNGPFYNNMRNLLIILLFYLGVSPNTLVKMYK